MGSFLMAIRGLFRSVIFYYVVHFHTLGPSTFNIQNFWTVLDHFVTFWPSTFKLLDRTLWHWWTVHFHPLIHSDLRHVNVHFGSKDRPQSLWTVHFGSNDCPFWFKTVHFWIDRSLLDRPSTFARPSTWRTVRFYPFGPSTLDLTRRIDCRNLNDNVFRWI